LIDPDRFPALALSSPHAVAASGSESKMSAAGNSRRERTRALLFMVDSFIPDQRRGRGGGSG
jgi:hypothetical protein